MSRISIQAVIEAVRSATGRPDRASLHQPELKGQEVAYLTRCIESGWVSYLGEFVDRFEQELAELSGCTHAIACVNGTVATHAALVVSGVRPADEVLLPALTFVASANAIRHASAIPHFVDSEHATLGLDPSKLGEYLDEIAVIDGDVCRNRNTGRIIRAVMPVHVFGHPVRMDELMAVARRFHLAVIEDAAEALGSRRNGKAIGCEGLTGVLSFNGNKIVTTGGGGAILTNDADLAARAKHITATAKKPHPYLFDHDEVAFNYRMPNVNAAIGCAQLEQLPGFLTRKRRLAETYAQSFDTITGVTFFREPKGATSNYWLNAILLDEDAASDRNDVLEALIAAGLQCRPAWTPMHQLEIFADCPRSPLTACEDIARRLINLPSSPALADS